MRSSAFNPPIYSALVITLIQLTLVIGCSQYQYYNEARFVRPDDKGVRFSDDEPWDIFLKTTYFYPVRDFFDPVRQWGKITGKGISAKNLGENGEVPDSSFYTNRAILGVDPAILARGSNRGAEPTGAFTILKIKDKGVSLGFIGEDENGHKYLIKLEDTNYPHLAGTAEIVTSRIYGALGYFVPETYLVTISGTGDERFDGKRALASRFVPGEVLGSYKFDWVRDRREFRGLKLAAAWLNDTDRAGHNTLAAVEEDLVTFYLIDFNGSLGSYRQGIPKKPWIGCRYELDIEKQITGLISILTLGLFKDRPCVQGEIVESRSLGYLSTSLDLEQWRPEKPNTAFESMTEEDAVWMARKMAQFSREQLEAIVAEAKLDDTETERLVEILLSRREAILEKYF
jgi:hypothetical protein